MVSEARLSRCMAVLAVDEAWLLGSTEGGLLPGSLCRLSCQAACRPPASSRLPRHSAFSCRPSCSLLCRRDPLCGLLPVGLVLSRRGRSLLEPFGSARRW